MEIKEQISNSPSNSSTFVAKLNGKEVGQCDIYLGRQFFNDHMESTRPFINKNLKGKHIYISSLDVEFEYQGKYIGTRLLYHVLKHYYLMGYRYVTLIDGSKRSGAINSIYKQIGLVESGNYCHMIGNIRHILFGKFKGRNGRNKNNNIFYRKKRIIPSV